MFVRQRWKHTRVYNVICSLKQLSSLLHKDDSSKNIDEPIKYSKLVWVVFEILNFVYLGQ